MRLLAVLFAIALLGAGCSSSSPTPIEMTAPTHELVANGFMFTAERNILLLPNVDMTCVNDASKPCRRNKDDSNWFYAIGKEEQGSVNVLPIEIISSWGLDVGSPPSFERFRTGTFQKTPGYVIREITVKGVEWGYGDSAHPLTDRPTEVVEYDEKGFFGGKGDLHHIIIKNPIGNTDYLDIGYVAGSPGAEEIVDGLLHSIAFFFATS